VAFAETLYHVDRAWIPSCHAWRTVRNHPIVLMDWQKRLLRDVFPPENGGRPMVRNFLYSANKKLGKSCIAGVVGAYLAATEPGSEVYVCAADKDQARDRVYKSIRYAVERGPLGDFAKVYRDRIEWSNGAVVQAFPMDYKGAAGGEPVAVIFDELHTYTYELEHRLWDEMVIPPTLPYGIRWVSSYAGWEGESTLLREVWDTVEAGAKVNSWPPMYRNDAAGWWGIIIQGERGYDLAPWTQDGRGRRFLAEAQQSERVLSYRRLFLNEWVVNEEAYIQPEWWDACQQSLPGLQPGDRTPLVVGLDASVSGDCSALVAVSRRPGRPQDVAVRHCFIWNPADLGGQVVQSATIEPTLRHLVDSFNVVCCVFDPFQLAKLAQDFRREGVGVWLEEFSQGDKRLLADTQLRQMIIARRVAHDGNPLLRQHVAINAAARVSGENRLRIVKKARGAHVDAAVALSMAAYQVLHLNL
jgi:phage terminase large subunit-like protein